MKIELITYKVGAGKMFWTYSVFIDGQQVKSKPLIYRMWDKEKTALRNGMKLINKTLTNDR